MLLETLDRGVLAGDGHLRLFFFSTAMAAPPRPSLAASTPSISPPAFASIRSKITPPFWLSQSGTVWSSTIVHSVVELRLDDRVVAALEQGGVVVGRASR